MIGTNRSVSAGTDDETHRDGRNAGSSTTFGDRRRIARLAIVVLMVAVVLLSGTVAGGIAVDDASDELDDPADADETADDADATADDVDGTGEGDGETDDEATESEDETDASVETDAEKSQPDDQQTDEPADAYSSPESDGDAESSQEQDEEDGSGDEESDGTIDETVDDVTDSEQSDSGAVDDEADDSSVADPSSDDEIDSYSSATDDSSAPESNDSTDAADTVEENVDEDDADWDDADMDDAGEDDDANTQLPDAEALENATDVVDDEVATETDDENLTESTDAVDGASDSANTTADGEEIENTTDAVDEDLSNTTDAVNETVENSTDTADEVTNDTTDTVEQGATNATDTVNGTVENTTDTVDEVTDTTNTLDASGVNASDTLDEDVENATDAVDDVMATTTDTIDETVTITTGTVDDTVAITSETVDGTVTTTTGTLDDGDSQVPSWNEDEAGYIDPTAVDRSGEVATDERSALDSTVELPETDPTRTVATTETVDGEYGETIDDTATGVVYSSIMDSADGPVSTTTVRDGGVSTPYVTERPTTVSVASPPDHEAAAVVRSPTEATVGPSDVDGEPNSPDREADDGPAGEVHSPIDRLLGSLPVDSTMAGAGIAVVGVGVVARYFSRAGTLQTVLSPSMARIQARRLRTLLAEWTSRVPFLFPVWYSQYDDTDPLENERRRRLYDAVEREPGVHVSRLASMTGIARSSVRYHVRILEAENLLAPTKIRGKRRLYPAGTESTAVAAALADDASAAVLLTLVERGPATVSDLATHLDRTPGTITHHLQQLAEDGVVSRERDGRSVQNWLTGSARRQLGELSDSMAVGPAEEASD